MTIRRTSIAISIIALFLCAFLVASRFAFGLDTSVPIHKVVWFTAGPLLVAMAAFKWPIPPLRWIALIINAFHAFVMLFAFGYMFLHVSAPPSVASMIPVALFGVVMLLAPLVNAVALSPGVWPGANNSFKPNPLRGSA